MGGGPCRHYDLVACTGDFLDNFGAESLATQVRWMRDWAHALPRLFLWCSGNQDVMSTAAPVSPGHWMAALPGSQDLQPARPRRTPGALPCPGGLDGRHPPSCGPLMWSWPTHRVQRVVAAWFLSLNLFVG